MDRMMINERKDKEEMKVCMNDSCMQSKYTKNVLETESKCFVSIQQWQTIKAVKS